MVNLSPSYKYYVEKGRFSLSYLKTIFTTALKSLKISYHVFFPHISWNLIILHVFLCCYNSIWILPWSALIFSGTIFIRSFYIKRIWLAFDYWLSWLLSTIFGVFTRKQWWGRITKRFVSLRTLTSWTKWLHKTMQTTYGEPSHLVHLRDYSMFNNNISMYLLFC